MLASITFAANGAAGENSNNASVSAITGVVIDLQTGEPLAGVKLSVAEAGKIIYSDLNGNFRINGLTPGKYNITSSFISYTSKNFNVDVVAGSPENIKIKLDQVH